MLDVALELGRGKRKKKMEGGVFFCGVSLITVSFREILWLR